MAVIIVSLFTCLCISAQIQRNILGVALGQSSQIEVTKIMTNNNINVSKMGMGTPTLYAKEIMFAGHIWEFAIIEFYKDKVCMIEFVEPSVNTSQHSLNNLWNKIYKELSAKYSKYVKKSNPEVFINCSDDCTIVEAGYKKQGSNMNLILHYIDIKLMSEKVRSYGNDL